MPVHDATCENQPGRANLRVLRVKERDGLVDPECVTCPIEKVTRVWERMPLSIPCQVRAAINPLKGPVTV